MSAENGERGAVSICGNIKLGKTNATTGVTNGLGYVAAEGVA